MRGARVVVLALVALLPVPTLACEGLMLSQPWIRQAPPGAAVMAGFGKLLNQGRKPITIESFAGVDFGSVELHQSSMSDGKMRMRRVDPLTLAPGQSVELAPGGYHLMLMRPKLPALGASSHVSLHCADGDLAADFPVRAAAAE
jgi:copper(I)-binding protein